MMMTGFVESKMGWYYLDCVKWYDCPKLLILCIFVMLTLYLNIKNENKNISTLCINLP
jgi:hypothetical protein